MFEGKDIDTFDTHDEPPPNVEVLEESEPFIQAPTDMEMTGEENICANNDIPSILQGQIGGLRPPCFDEIELEEEEVEEEGSSSHFQRDTIGNLRLYLDLDSDECQDLCDDENNDENDDNDL